MTDATARRAPRNLVVGEALTAFMSYPGESVLAFHEAIARISAI